MKILGPETVGLGDLLGIILASYIGIIINYYKDPF